MVESKRIGKMNVDIITLNDVVKELHLDFNGLASVSEIRKAMEYLETLGLGDMLTLSNEFIEHSELEMDFDAYGDKVIMFR